MCDRSANKAMERQPKYGLFDNNCQRFVTLLAWDILKIPSFELDLIAGEEIIDEAKDNIGVDKKSMEHTSVIK